MEDLLTETEVKLINLLLLNFLLSEEASEEDRALILSITHKLG